MSIKGKLKGYGHKLEAKGKTYIAKKKAERQYAKQVYKEERQLMKQEKQAQKWKDIEAKARAKAHKERLGVKIAKSLGQKLKDAGKSKGGKPSKNKGSGLFGGLGLDFDSMAGSSGKGKNELGLFGSGGFGSDAHSFYFGSSKKKKGMRIL